MTGTNPPVGCLHQHVAQKHPFRSVVLHLPSVMVMIFKGQDTPPDEVGNQLLSLLHREVVYRTFEIFVSDAWVRLCLGPRMSELRLWPDLVGDARMVLSGCSK